MNKVSIIVPVYNVQAYLERCIQSLFDQTYRDIEIIAVDDCSQDESLRILHRLKAKDVRLRIIEQPENAGLGRTRDEALKHASGPYVLFVDSDDYLHPKTVELCVRATESHQADMVEFGYRMTSEIKPHHHPVPDDFPTRILDRTSDPRSLILLEKKTDHISCNKLFRLDIIRQHGIEFRRRRFEDTEFTREYLMCIRRAVFIDLPLYTYYMNPSSLTHTLAPRNINESIEAANEVYELFDAYHVPDAIKKRFKAGCRKHLLTAMLPLNREDRIVCLQGGGEPHTGYLKIIEYLVRKHNRIGFPVYCYIMLGPRFLAKKILRK